MSVEAPSAVISGKAGPIVNEGPVGPNFRLEDTMPLVVNRFNVTGEIRFNEFPEEIPGSSAIPSVFLEAFDPNAKAKKIWDELTAQESPTPEMFHRAFLAAAAAGKSPQTFGWPRANLEYITSVLQGQSVEAEAKGLDKKVAGFHIPAPKAEVQQTLGEKTQHIFEQQAHKISHIQEEEEVEGLRLKYVKDEPVARQRIYDIEEAVEKAYPETQPEGDEEIEGSSINKYLYIHEGLISGLVRGTNRPDGSLDETLKDLKARRFTSKKEAKEYSTFLVSKLVPVTVAKEGDSVKDEDVTRVDKNRSPYREVLIRDEKKRKVRVVETQEELQAPTVTTIQDYPDLAEVFDLKQAA